MRGIGRLFDDAATILVNIIVLRGARLILHDLGSVLLLELEALLGSKFIWMEPCLSSSSLSVVAPREPTS